jgi:hypothetical protein|tara:strand:- start:88 stop:408 length:321 start_codon:yes stop_codon:yes gene_type:complete
MYNRKKAEKIAAAVEVKMNEVGNAWDKQHPDMIMERAHTIRVEEDGHKNWVVRIYLDSDSYELFADDMSIMYQIMPSAFTAIDEAAQMIDPEIYSEQESGCIVTFF